MSCEDLKNWKPTAVAECQPCPAGLSKKIYVQLAEDSDGPTADENGGQLTGYRIDLRGMKEPEPGDECKGWPVTGKFKIPFDSPEEERAWVRYMRSGTHMPRRRKKMLMNRVLRNTATHINIANLMLGLPPIAYNYVASLMFPERSLPLITTRAEDRLVRLCMDRVMRKMRRKLTKAATQFMKGKEDGV